MKPTVKMFVLLSLIAFTTRPIYGQATFNIGSGNRTLSATGQAELLGEVTFRVTSGTTVDGTLEVSVSPVAFVNDETSGIMVEGTGGLVGASIVGVFQESGLVVVEIPAGAGVGASVTVSGMRVPASDPGITDTVGQIAVSGNLLEGGSTEVSLVTGVVDGLVVDENSDSSFTVLNGFLVDPLDELIFKEGHALAFSGAVGVLGQTILTQVIVEITGIPENVTVTFPDTVDSRRTDATLTTLSGDDESFTSSPDAQRVVYEFNEDLPESDNSLDNFRLLPDVEFGDPVGDGTVTIQMTLGPSGADDVPRFTEELLPDFAVPESEPTSAYFPVSRVWTGVELTITNPAAGGALVTLRARDDAGDLISGADVSSETVENLAGNETLVLGLDAMFGSAATPEMIASIEMESVQDDLIGATIGSIEQSRQATALIDDRRRFYLPFARTLATSVPELTVHNPGNAPVEVTLTLRDASGEDLGRVVETIESLAALRSPLGEIFELEAGALPFEGYVRLSADEDIRATIVNDPEGAVPEEVPALRTFSKSNLEHPYFVFGGGWNTILTLINTSGGTVNVTLTLRDTAGQMLEGTASLAEQMAARSLHEFDLQALFGGLGFAVGHLDVEIERPPGLFSSTPAFAGVARLQTAGVSALAPLPAASGTELLLAPTAQSDDEWTGIAIFNPSSVETVATIEVFSSEGTSLGTTDVTIPGNTVEIGLVRELSESAVDNENTFVRITSDRTIQAVGYRGSADLDTLWFIQARAAP